MDETKHVKIQDMDVEKSPISQETEDNANVNELALELAKNVVTTAVKTVEGSNPAWWPGGLSRYTMPHYQATNIFSTFFCRC